MPRCGVSLPCRDAPWLFLFSESDLLSMLDHPNIVECKDVIRSPRQLVLVLEWLRCVGPADATAD